MKRMLYVLMLVVTVVSTGCAGIGLVSSPTGQGQRIVGDNIEIGYNGNYILQNVPAIGETPACVRTFFDVVISIKNTGTKPLTITPQDFTLTSDDGLILTPEPRKKYCELFHTDDCAAAKIRLQKLKEKDEQAWSMAMAMNNNKIAGCNNLQLTVIDQEGFTIEPGKARAGVWLVFFDNRFSKRYFYQHSFEVRYLDLPPFVLADKDYWEIQQESGSSSPQEQADTQ